MTAQGLQEALACGDVEPRQQGGRMLYFFPEQVYGDREDKGAKGTASVDQPLSKFDENKFFSDHNWCFDATPEEWYGIIECK